MEEPPKSSFLEPLKQVYEKKYKLLMFITIGLLIFSLGVLAYQKATTGEFIQKDVSLKGGLLITIQTDKEFDTDKLENQITAELDVSTNVESLTALAGQPLGYTIELEKTDSKAALAAIEQITGVPSGTYTVEESSSALSESFFKSVVKSIVIAFIFMSAMVFVYFRLPFRSFAVILAGFSDLIETIAFMQIFGIKLSTGGVAALLMLIGYSVDADILLSARVLKQQHTSTMDAIYSSIKTGLTMQITAVAALAVLYIATPAAMLKQISIILIIGLCIGMLNAWIQNAGLLRWYLTWRQHGK